MSAVTADPRDVPAVMQAVRLQCYRENIYGALDILQLAQATYPDPRYTAEIARIRSWLTHLDSRDAYVGAQEDPASLTSFGKRE